MTVIDGLHDEDATFDRSVLTVGNFDGVHRGHRRIIAVARELADKSGAPVVALTFEPHPLSILKQDAAPERLTLPARKFAYLEEAGVDVVVVARSTPELLGLSAERFVADILVGRFHPTDIVEGPNFGFGRGRTGDVRMLWGEGERHGFGLHVVEVVQTVNPDGARQRISSSYVRAMLRQGRVDLAADALAKAYALEGLVERGAGRGRSLGFPTANVSVAEQLIPADGVYAGTAEVGGEFHKAAISIGTTPTFDGSQRQVEAHLLDFSSDIYGQAITVNFNERLRSQRKFESSDSLMNQIEMDLAACREVAR